MSVHRWNLPSNFSYFISLGAIAYRLVILLSHRSPTPVSAGPPFPPLVHFSFLSSSFLSFFPREDPATLDSLLVCMLHVLSLRLMQGIHPALHLLYTPPSSSSRAQRSRPRSRPRNSATNPPLKAIRALCTEFQGPWAPSQTTQTHAAPFTSYSKCRGSRRPGCCQGKTHSLGRHNLNSVLEIQAEGKCG
ncbi:hypothetical protein SODALDRAFT_200024 [Sodiomyces alkalinus F11]|uniref:Uncharacterized protein n=1 Tax=Sodiomyces alkalinus (strain CBS 110278 / VKM F-3762 / F11) TaxID=1314773 RepID=A0A3N2PST1_SODAK|nr:hypothetical protein SODALDRAFT_200024 [Sodiomyces alkalinus F11]ROT37567.1 hypothetical protein SODALDRAFT_200024 [Sodiomyces alkalinus F11]